MLITLSDYPTLFQYVFLSPYTIVNGSNVLTTIYSTTSKISDLSYFTGGKLDSIDVNTAQQDLTKLINDIIHFSPRNAFIPNFFIDGTKSITLSPGVIYTTINTGNLTLIAGNIEFNEPGQYLIFVNGSINFGVNVNLKVAPECEVFWYATGNIEVNCSELTGTLIGNNITLGNSITLNGNAYSPSGTITVNNNLINPSTIEKGVVNCYLKGTKLLTEEGYVEIEKLSEGKKLFIYGKILNNEVVVKENERELVPIRWISRFFIMKRNSESWPICFKQGSLGENIPSEDLYVSPGHRIIHNDKFCLAANMINNDTIFQDKTIRTIEYYHLELEDHSIIMANGALAETYLDFDNKRERFEHY